MWSRLPITVRVIRSAKVVVHPVGGDEDIGHRQGGHVGAALRQRIGVGGHHGGPVVAGGAAAVVEPVDQGAERQQPDLVALRQVPHRLRGQPAGPEEGVDPALAQGLRRLPDARGRGDDVLLRVQPRGPQHPLGHQPHPRGDLADRDPLAPQVGDLVDVGVLVDDHLDVVVVEPRAAAQPVRVGAALGAVLLHGVGGGDGEVGLPGRHPPHVLLRALAGPQRQVDLGDVLVEGLAQQRAVLGVDPRAHPGAHGERGARRRLAERRQPPQQQGERHHRRARGGQGAPARTEGNRDHAGDPASPGPR